MWSLLGFHERRGGWGEVGDNDSSHSELEKEADDQGTLGPFRTPNMFVLFRKRPSLVRFRRSTQLQGPPPSPSLLPTLHPHAFSPAPTNLL